MILTPEKMDFSKQTFSAIIYGSPGIGKTTLACSAPKPLLIDFDRGVSRVRADHRVTTVVADTYEEVWNDLQDPMMKEFETIIIDTGGSFVTYLKDWAFRTNQSGHSHRLGQTINNVLIDFSTKPDGFQYGFVPDEVWGTECYGNNTKVKVGGFEPGRTYLFQHYVAETWQTGNNDNRRYYIKVNGVPLKLVDGTANEGADYGFAVFSADKQELVDKFNAGLANIKANGKYDEIIAKYLG